MRCYQCLCLALVIGCVIFQDVSGVARVKRSANENLRDPGTYIIHFKDSTTDAQLQHFTKQLNRRSNRSVKFEASIISEYPNIKCLTARLSKKALKWVRILNIALSILCGLLYFAIMHLSIKSTLLIIVMYTGYMSQTGSEHDRK